MKSQKIAWDGCVPDSRNGVPPVSCLTHSEKKRKEKKKISSWTPLG
jgi:hypothetical protein